MYKGIAWSCLLFGSLVFWSSYQIVPLQQTETEIISVLLFGIMGAVIAGMGLFGLWEIRKKSAN